MFVLIPLFTLLGAAVNGLVGVRWFSRRAVGATAVGAAGLSFAAAVAAFARLLGAAEPVAVRTLFTWVPASLVRTSSGALAALRIDMAFRYDSLAAVMTLVVTGVGLLIHIYSLGYMAHDKSYARFFAYLNLFTFAMLILVLGANLGVMFIGWEGVGLCSYLLIGFWFTKDSAANAGKKAFITNRVGDFGFLLGTGLLVYALGTVDIAAIAAAVEAGALAKGTATAAALLLFLGATGKSAQIPLYTWLPDAMEGPTPVSALIHAATMVTAGVYMVARLHVLFSFSGTALTVVALTGAFTAVYAATMGLVQTDIKRVLAYSTISQIGYMFIGLGVGAYAAGDLPPHDPRFLQKPALPRGRERHPRPVRGAGHAEDGRIARPHPPDLPRLPGRGAGHLRHPGTGRVLLQGRDPGLGFRLGELSRLGPRASSGRP